MSHVTTVGGRGINLWQIQRELVSLQEIAHHLSLIRRFAGATKVGYSVAAHALHVSAIVRKLGGTLSAQLAALHHDDHEYLIGDTIQPVKEALNTHFDGAWRAFEGIVQRQVLEALHLRTAFVAHRQIIHRADMIALATERRDLQPPGEAWPCLEGIDADAEDILARAAIPDHVWAERFLELDADLRRGMAELFGYPPEFEVAA